jgi:hypothetical protein
MLPWRLGGDVNGDGYGDLLADTAVGILVFHGGSAGIRVNGEKRLQLTVELAGGWLSNAVQGSSG